MIRPNRDLPRARVCFGIDLQGDTVRVVRAERVRGRVVCASASPAAAAGPRALAAAALSCREAFTRWLEAPFASRSKAAKVLPTLLDIQLPFALEDCQYQFVQSLRGADKKGLRTLAAVARNEAVDGRLASLRAKGFDPAILDHEGLALWSQTLREHPPGKAETALLAIVYLGSDHSTLVLGRGREYLSSHSILAEDASHLQRLIDAHRDSSSSGLRWIWSGPRAASPAAIAALYSRLTPAAAGATLTVRDPADFLARAVATRALEPEPLRCNLRIGPYLHAALAARRRRRDLAAALLVLVSGLALCVVSGLTQCGIARESRRQAAAIASLSRAMAGYDIGPARGEQALRMLNEAIVKRRESLAPFRRAFNPSLTGIIQNILAIGRAGDLRFEVITLSADRLEVSGAARDWHGSESLLAYLKECGYAAKLTRREAVSGEVVPFTISTEGTP